MSVASRRWFLAALGVAATVVVGCAATSLGEGRLISVTVRGVTGATDMSLTPSEITAFETYWSAKRRAVLPARQGLGDPIRLAVRREQGGCYARVPSAGADFLQQTSRFGPIASRVINGDQTSDQEPGIPPVSRWPQLRSAMSTSESFKSLNANR